MDHAAGRRLSRDEIADSLTEARVRTLLLIQGVTAEDLGAQHSPLMSPIVWDLGHIAHFEDVWLVRNLAGGDSKSEGLSGVYNPFENPRASRGALELPAIGEAERVMIEVRKRVLTHLENLDLEGDDPLLNGGFVFRLVLQHEYQHQETILQTLQLKGGEPYRPPRALPDARFNLSDGNGAGAEEIWCPGGHVPVGTDDRSQAYDNERPLHHVDLQPFFIDRTPVTNASFERFIRAGGYETEEWWSREGWAWVRSEGATAPLYWSSVDGSWVERTMNRVAPIEATRPVCHVSYYEADAYARWAGKRLPTEFEWEVAASWDPAGGEKRLYPWGDAIPSALRANLDHLAFRPLPVDSFPAGVSPIGCSGMIGDVWEWTSSDFHGYPGYETFPYPEYSEIFFGDEYKVLRGGSWATRPGAIRNTFRNWDYPVRRQIFSGFRCARDG